MATTVTTSRNKTTQRPLEKVFSSESDFLRATKLEMTELKLISEWLCDVMKHLVDKHIMQRKTNKYVEGGLCRYIVISDQHVESSNLLPRLT